MTTRLCPHARQRMRLCRLGCVGGVRGCATGYIPQAQLLIVWVCVGCGHVGKLFGVWVDTAVCLRLCHPGA
jgi:hypothetical protein